LIPEVVLLALASTVRPTSLAAVSALLSRDSRRRLMFAYVIGGWVFTFVFGLVVVGVFHGIHIRAGTDRTVGIADIIGGLAALVLGFAVLAGWFRRRPDRAPAGPGTRWMPRLDHQVSVGAAALAGPLTHIPGIFYLIALNVIVAHNPRLPGGAVAVAIYDAIWFAVPIAALVMCVVDPDAARDVVVTVHEWARRHSRTIVVGTSFVVGVALLIRGVLSL
jgi:cytochrome bd-type quinol oxidase subunit 2